MSLKHLLSSLPDVQEESRLRLNSRERKTVDRMLDYVLQPLVKEDDRFSARGGEGIQKADDILRERQARGILIGPNAVRVWNYNRTPESVAPDPLEVMVLDHPRTATEAFSPTMTWPGGIAWFFPVHTRDLPNSPAYHFTFFGGPGITTVFYGAKLHNPQQSPLKEKGLYLVGPDFVHKALFNQAVRGLRLHLNDDRFGERLASGFKRELDKKFGTRVPSFIEDALRGRILRESEYYTRNDQVYGGIQPVLHDELRAEVLRGIEQYFQQRPRHSR